MGTPRRPRLISFHEVLDLSPTELDRYLADFLRPGRVFTVDTLAEFLGKSPGTVKGWRARGTANRGPAFIQIGAAIFYPLEGVLEWLREQRVESGEVVRLAPIPPAGERPAA